MKKFQLLFLFLLGAILTTTIISCNKDFVRTLPGDKYQDTATVKYGNRKVLYLIVDGARGVSVQNANTPVLHALTKNSIYTWVGLSDPDATAQATNWASMLTGVKKEKHFVLTNDFLNSNLQNYPVLFERIKEINTNVKVASYTSSAAFKNNLTDGADVSELVTTDAEVKDAVINNLKTDTASLIVGQFGDVNAAGAQYGYDNSFAPYKKSIEDFDGYVGEILTALEGRENYDNEEWLIVVASSAGGKFTIPANDNDNTVFSNTLANTFTIYHNTKYKTRIISKPFTGNRYLGKTVRLYGKDVRAEIDTVDAELFNIDDTTRFTIELKVKKNEDEFYYPSILGKRREWSGGHPSVGWVIYLEGKYWYFEWRGTKDGDYRQCRGGDLRKGIWENVSVKCEKRGTQRFIRTYTNGVFNNELEITASGSLSNHDKLKLGFLNGNGHGEPNVYVSDIRFFKFPVPDNVIANYACETSIDESHPDYNFLAAYWPATDGQGSIIADVGPQARDFNLIGAYQWTDFNDIICPPSAAALATFVPQTVDIPSQIINWFKISNQQRWGLDSRVWLDQ
ncbi:alkaline phosphatase family protein [Mucilaginibacter gynuensis]